jgi:hypothetical protein
VPLFRFFVATDRFVETWLATDRFRASIPKSGSWSARASGHPEVLAPNLTMSIGSNQTTVQLPLVGVNKCPLPTLASEVS